jgi:hypothetical protein
MAVGRAQTLIPSRYMMGMKAISEVWPKLERSWTARILLLAVFVVISILGQGVAPFRRRRQFWSSGKSPPEKMGFAQALISKLMAARAGKLVLDTKTPYWDLA